MYGILAVGNKIEDFIFKEDEQELLKVFAKQAAIAVENDLLITRARDLAVKDDLTGLYNQKYIHTRLDEEIKRACMYQRPCGYLLIDMDNFKNLTSNKTPLSSISERIFSIGSSISEKICLIFPWESFGSREETIS